MYSYSFDIRSLQRHARSASAQDAGIAAASAPGLAYDGPITPREEALFWLSAAAEIEHALMVQYLFAAYSLDIESAGVHAPSIRNAQFLLLQIAREEMGHLMTVQNVIAALGGALHFERAHSPLTSDVHPFRIRLEPVSLASIAKYVVAESPDMDPAEIGMLSDDRKALLGDVIHPLARQSNDGQEVLHVGPIFARLIELIAGALDDADFRTDRAARQARWEDWGFDASNTATPSAARGGRVLVETIVATTPAEVRAQIVRALRAIGDQGEFVDALDDLEESHFERFLQLFEALREVEATTGRLPVWPVARLPNTSVASAGAGVAEAAAAMMRRHVDEGRITNPRSRLWAHLFNLRYRLLVEVVAHGLLREGPLYRPEPEAGGRRTPAGHLHAFAFAEMNNLRLLAAKLVSMPLDDGASGLNAGPPFELGETVALPPVEADRWRGHADRFAAGAAWAERTRAANARDADDPFLIHLVASDRAAQALCLAIETGGGNSPLENGATRFRDVARALEEGVRGFDISQQPSGGFHGNFWAGKTRDELLAYRTPLGSVLIEPGAPDRSELLGRIGAPEGERATMPRARPPLPAARLRLITDWIAAGAPDDMPNGAVGIERPPRPKPEPRPDRPGAAPAPAEPQPGAPIFERDVRPLFTAFHRQAMLFAFDLHAYAEVRANHVTILARLKNGSMPCIAGGGPLPAQDIATFEAWITGGFQTDGTSPPDRAPPELPPPPEPDPDNGELGEGPYRNHRWRATNAPAAPGTRIPRYDDIWHVDADIGWAVNSDGYILATRDGWATVRIWERDGRFVRLLMDEAQPAIGARDIGWNFRNYAGELEEVGAFLIRITLDDRSHSHLAYRRHQIC